MFANKRDVDRHVTQSTKNLSENERSNRGFTISKAYAKVSEHEIARDWLQRYLDIKTDDAAAHKFMGEICERLGKTEQALTSYQRSHNLNSKQNDLIKHICRLFLLNDGWSSCPSKAKYWCEKADEQNVRDDSVLSLRLKMINKDKKGGGKPVEELILKEIASRPHEIGLRTRIVNFLIEEKRFNDAFKYCFDLEMKFIENFQQSIDWYNCIASCLSKQTVTDSWNYWCLLLISLDKRIYLNLKKDLSLLAVKQTNLKDVTNLIFEFDQVLKKASDSLVVLTPTKELADEFVSHYRGQLALHISSVFIQKQKVSGNDQWRDTIKKSLPFLLFAFQSSTVNTEAFWLKNTNDIIRNLFNHLKKEGAFRCSQSGRTLLACKNIGGDEKFGSLKLWKSIDDIFNQVRETCADLNWRKNIYRQLFANADQQTKISSSYIVQSTNFAEPKYEIISFNDLETYEDIAQHLYPSSLEHHVYLGIGRKDLHSYKTRTFNNLNLSTSNLINCSPETINRIDLDSFLYCSVIQAKRRLEAEKDCFESFSKDPCEKPLILPAANMVEGLCSEEQNEWWLSAFKVYKNISGDSLAQLKATLQYGIEAVRGIDTPKIDVIIVLKLGDVLLARAAAGEKIDERRHFELRAEYVFKIAMRMLRGKDNDNFRKLFKYSTVNLDVDREIDHLVGTAIGFLSSNYFKREEYREFIEDFTGLNNAWASFFCAEAYKKLDESSKTPKKSKKLYSEKARENLVETLQLLDGNENFERNNPLRSRVERELKRLQYDLSSSFNEDHEYHNTSANGHLEDEIFHNASATSFKARRELSAISQSYNEKFVEVENMIKKLNDLLITVKDDVLCVRNDISDLKDEVFNVRGEIADSGKDSKVMDTVFKALEDLTFQISYMTNFAMNASNPRNSFPPQAQLPPMNPQMYNSPGYNLPMQYPTPAMVQRPPQPAPPMAYDPMMLAQQNMQKNTLLDALNTPSVLSAWNNTYNPPKMQVPTVPQVAQVSKPPPQMMTPTMSPSMVTMNAFPSASQPQFVPQHPIQNKPVEKAPPVNVVITSSDPLPAQNSFISQPTLSVTIPPQHIKHPPQPVKSFVTTPQYENISPVKDTSEYLEEPADYDPRPDFKPIIPLPDEVETKTGEENEDVMFMQRCKLFRFTENEWKERGIGNIKILKGKDNGKYRILMRREQIHKLCANHAITSEMELKSTAKDNQWIWGASDFSEDEVHLEKFLVRFKTADQAKKFKEAFDEAKKNAPKDTAEKPKEVAKTNSVSTPTQSAVSSTTSFTSTPKAAFSFGGLTGNLQPTTPVVEKVKETESADNSKPSPFANFTFGQSANKSFSELFGGISKTPTSAPAEPEVNKSQSNEDEVEQYEPNVHFEPVIALPDLIEVKTGEEEEDSKFSHRAKLLRYDATTKEWKERGIGEMKVLVNKKDSSKARLLMRREQIFKLCCNMSITKELEFKKMNGTTYSFAGQDFSENEIHPEFLAIKFKTSELVEQFVNAVKDVQKNLGKVSEKKVEEKKPAEAAKGFGDKFKPKVGSWTCEGCYISNKADDLYCVACDSPKDSTVPKKEAKSAFAPDPNAPSFSFGMPNASGFSFGMPAAADSTTTIVEPPKASPAQTSFSFGSLQNANSQTPAKATSSFPPASSTSFSFGSNVAAAAPASFSFGGDKPFSFNLTDNANKENEDANINKDASAANDAGFNFVFKKKSPAKKSPGKTRNDSVNSEGGEEDENEYHEEEENQTYFTPVIALPEKVDIKTGEEDEEVLYSHRAKLFKFSDKEWKERGIGDIKILKHRVTGKLRVVMRREQVLKICLNFFLTSELELLAKGENSWTFGAIDFSEGEFESHSFALRFKNAEIAKEFKKATEDALAGKSVEKQDNESDEKSQLVKKLQLPSNFFDYLNAKDCSGCIGCKSDDYVFKTYKDVDDHALPSVQPKLVIKSKPQNVEKSVQFNTNKDKSPETANIFGGIKKSEAAPNIFAKYNEEHPQIPPANIFGTMNSFGAKPQENSIFSSSLNTTPTSSDAKVTFGMKPADTGIFGVKSTFSFSSPAPTNGNIFGTESKDTPSPFSTSLFGNAQNTDSNSSNIFGSGGNSFSFADAAKELDKSKESMTSTNIFSSGSSGFSFAEAVKDLNTSSDDKAEKVPDFIAKSNDFGGFAALATNGEATWASKSASTTPAGGFFGLTVKSDIFSKIATGEVDTNQNADDANGNDDNYDPHYEPIISLPDEIKVSTGEEEEIKLFGERSKLFRFDAKTKEWKERGVGELKILHHPVNGTYRFLMRREQIHKLVLNQIISDDLHMTPMDNSPKAFMWAGMNFSESKEGETEQLAARFKNEDLANRFMAKVSEAIELSKANENLHPEND